jgi:hypothetical protein
VGKPLTDEECLAVGVEIEEAARSGEGAAIDRMIDWDSIEKRSTAGIDVPEPFRLGFLKGFAQARATGKSFSHVLGVAVKDG